LNPDLDRLQPYPFQKLGDLLKNNAPPSTLKPVNLSIGEPKHATPEFIKRVLAENLDGLAGYPATAGTEPLRNAIAQWLQRRFGLKGLDPLKHVLPVNGSREALFAFAQSVVDATRPATVVMPNPFYQIYEGAALLAEQRPSSSTRSAATASSSIPISCRPRPGIACSCSTSARPPTPPATC
jgi:N-succinyldiaminopimelate aminotransferase